MTDNSVNRIKIWWLLNYGFSLLLGVAFVRLGTPTGTLAWGYAAAVWLTYALVYRLPAIALGWLLYRLMYPRWPKVYWLSVVLLCGISYLLIFADSRLFELFGFHINSFVINLVTTPGGIESLGNSQSAELTFALIGLVLMLVPAVLLVPVRRLARRGSLRLRWLLIAFVLLAVAERLVYGFSDFKLYSPVLKVSDAFPVYNRLSMRSFSQWLGLENTRPKSIHAGMAQGDLHYPLRPLEVKPPQRPLNLVWLVAESLRFDMLTPEIMPNTWKFSQQSLRLEQNLSGGNGTRQGLFALMYGLYGAYWDVFLRENQGPLLLDVLKQQNYQFYMTTSASFTYPEFDRTLFSAVDASDLHHGEEGQPAWQRDMSNAETVSQFIRQRDPTRPFMSFFFLESTHARYYFPDSAVIRSPYLGDVNYALMSRKSLRADMDLLLNRYINASHHVDVQVGKILDTLKQQDLQDDTIVVITGDHGEEFMAKGHWGHNAGFHDEQIDTPMVLHIPGKAPAVIHETTSHMDIIPTLMPLLDVTNPATDYAQGQSIFDPQRRGYVVASDWSGVAYINDKYKFYVPYRSMSGKQNVLSSRDDQSVPDSTVFYQTHMDDIRQVLQGARVFIAGESRQQ